MKQSKSLQRFLVLALTLFLLAGCYNFKHETIPGTYPVKEINITWCNGKLFEVWVKVQQGVRLNSLVDTSFFDGLTYRMSLDTAQQRLGQPRSVRTEPEMHVPVHLYPVEKGEVGFMAVRHTGGIEHQVWAFPTNTTPAAIMPDASLREQLLHKLSADKARVHILRDVGFGGITVSMTSNRVDYLILGLRDGE